MFDDDITDPGSTTQSNDCTECGGSMSWDPSAVALVCSYCGKQQTVEADRLAPAEVTIAEFEQTQRKEAFLATSRRLGCNRCGAVIDFQGVVASRCDFCGAHAVAEIQDHAEAVRPSGIIPFQVDAETVKKSYREWVAKQPFVPGPVREGIPLEELRGVYLPFWVFDVRVESDASARCAFPYIDAHGEQRVRWERRGKVSERMRTGLGIYASEGLPHPLVDGLAPWYSESANAWEEAFLSGFPAEAPRVEPLDAWERAKKQIERLEFLDLHGSWGAEQIANFKLKCQFHGANLRLVYMPVWIAAYRYQGRIFRFLVNGRTGEATGVAPVDRHKIIKITAAVALLTIFVALPGACSLAGVQCEMDHGDAPSHAPMPISPGKAADSQDP